MDKGTRFLTSSMIGGAFEFMIDGTDSLSHQNCKCFPLKSGCTGNNYGEEFLPLNAYTPLSVQKHMWRPVPLEPLSLKITTPQSSLRQCRALGLLDQCPVGGEITLDQAKKDVYQSIGLPASYACMLWLFH